MASEEPLENFRVLGQLASGGMGTVDLAERACVNHQLSAVAIKRPHRKIRLDPELCRAFAREARLALLIRHPNVVSAKEFIETEDRQYLVMDYIEGETLAGLLRRRSPFEDAIAPSLVCGIICGALRGLQAAHDARDETGIALKLVHRDVSPQNIIVGMDGVARLTDFGIATTRAGTLGPGASRVMGKPGYMAPEQLRGQRATRRSDLYSMGVVFWEMLTGVRMRSNSHLSREKREAPVPPSRVEPTVSRELDDVVMRALACDARVRFPSAQDMAKAIERVLHPAPPQAIGRWVSRRADECVRARRGMGPRHSSRKTGSVLLGGPGMPV